MKILHLIDSLDHSGSASQLQLLAPALANEHAAVTVCCLGADTPKSQSLRQAGVTVHTLGWKRWFDFDALWTLRAIIRETAFDVIHVWRLNALRALAVVANGQLSRVVMSAPPSATRKLAWWNRHLLNRVCCVAVPPAIEKTEKRCQDPFLEKGSDTFFRIACIGNAERAAGFRQAIWAFDFVLHAFPDTHLQLVGDGSQLPALRRLVDGLECGDRVQFLGERADAGDVQRAADIVWIPSQANTGRQVALEAMALGRVVVASDVPYLREVVADGVTGYLIPVGDVIQYVRRTCWLLQDAHLRERIGAAARTHVEQNFPLNAALTAWLDAYRRVAAA
jgi:glycosyltransferase involved in cell wall biosynthesis